MTPATLVERAAPRGRRGVIARDQCRRRIEHGRHNAVQARRAEHAFSLLFVGTFDFFFGVVKEVEE